MTDFQQRVLRFYEEQGRDLPWRHLATDPTQRLYEVIVSEMMLQQTQVPRVVQKYRQWLARFPTMTAAAEVSLQEILEVWQGLGYARRAKYLQGTCRELVGRDNLPSSIAELIVHKGIGINTAAAVLVYTFNQPQVFIETNIRTVYIAEFFSGHTAVSDADIAQKLSETLYVTDPRTWYWALMDYGTFLKTQGHTNVKSTAYARQSSFSGSKRQVRAAVLKSIVQEGPQKRSILLARHKDARAGQCLDDLIMDGLLADLDGIIVVHGDGVK